MAELINPGVSMPHIPGTNVRLRPAADRSCQQESTEGGMAVQVSAGPDRAHFRGRRPFPSGTGPADVDLDRVDHTQHPGARRSPWRHHRPVLYPACPASVVYAGMMAGPGRTDGVLHAGDPARSTARPGIGRSRTAARRCTTAVGAPGLPGHPLVLVRTVVSFPGADDIVAGRFGPIAGLATPTRKPTKRSCRVTGPVPSDGRSCRRMTPGPVRRRVGPAGRPAG